MIKLIQINNFRNYEYVKINVGEYEKSILVLHGENGQGKTNVLEAISLFAEGKGLRRARYEDMIRKDSIEKFWNIIIKTEEESFSSGYIGGEKSGKRIFKVSEKFTKNLKEFAKNNYVLWMTYETDRLFMMSPAHRRDFIDMFCNSRNNFHASNMLNYEKLTRERHKILKEYFDNGKKSEVEHWLGIVEDKIANLGLEIANARINMTNELEASQIKDSRFPEFKNQMIGRLEDEIIRGGVEDQENAYKAALVERRQKDYITKTTTLGPNRSDWKVLHVGNNIEAGLCSAGEQKMLLSCVFLSFIMHNIKSDMRNLILLLDDVIAHLDSNHRDLLFAHIKDLVNNNREKVSVWLSGTDRKLFDELKDEALFVQVKDNTCFIQ